MNGYEVTQQHVAKFLQNLGYKVDPVAWDYSDLPLGAQGFINRMWLMCDYRNANAVFQVFLIELRDYGTHHEAKHPIIESFYRRYPQGNYLFILTPPGRSKITLVNLKSVGYKIRLRTMRVSLDQVDSNLQAFTDSLHVSHMVGPDQIATRQKRVFDEVERQRRHRAPNSDGLSIYNLLLKDLVDYKVPSPEKQLDFIRQAHGSGVEAKCARNELMLRNMRLVIHVASKYLGRGLDFNDLIQEGTFGLLHAIDNFDEGHGTQFSTYAVWWIRQAIARAIADKGRIVRLPVHVQEKLVHIQEVADELREVFGREPTDLEVALKAGLLPARQTQLGWLCLAKCLKLDAELENSLLRAAYRIHRMRRWLTEPLSLEQTLTVDQIHFNEVDAREIESDELTVSDIVPCDDLQMMEQVWRKQLRVKLQRALERVPERDREVIVQRYGLRDGERHTLETIGQELGVTRERIRQIEGKVFDILKNPRRSREFLRYLDRIVVASSSVEQESHASDIEKQQEIRHTLYEFLRWDFSEEQTQQWLSLSSDEQWAEVVQALSVLAVRRPECSTHSLTTYLNYLGEDLAQLDDEELDE